MKKLRTIRLARRGEATCEVWVNVRLKGPRNKAAILCPEPAAIIMDEGTDYEIYQCARHYINQRERGLPTLSELRAASWKEKAAGKET